VSRHFGLKGKKKRADDGTRKEGDRGKRSGSCTVGNFHPIVERAEKGGKKGKAKGSEAMQNMGGFKSQRTRMSGAMKSAKDSHHSRAGSKDCLLRPQG